MIQKLTLVLISLLPLLGIAQKKITISGYVKDDANKEVLIRATVINANSKSGPITNQYGYYSITAPSADTMELIVSFNGYNIQAKKISARENLRLDVLMQLKSDNLSEVIVTAGKNTRNVQKAQMGVIDIPLTAIKNLPMLAGERDVLKIIQLLPG